MAPREGAVIEALGKNPSTAKLILTWSANPTRSPRVGQRVVASPCRATRNVSEWRSDAPTDHRPHGSPHGSGDDCSPTIKTLADLRKRLGGIPLDRIWFHPAPGTATEKDVLEVEVRENRLCELVDGTLVEKAMGFEESRLAFELGPWSAHMSARMTLEFASVPTA